MEQRDHANYAIANAYCRPICCLTGRLDGDDDSDLFTFVRLKYRGELTRLSSWRVDWPASDRNFIYQLSKQTNISVAPREKIIEVGASELFEYPFAYMLEVGESPVKHK